MDLVGRAIPEMFVRPMLVVPTDVERQLLPEPLPVKRNEHQLPCALGLDRSYQPLDHGDAAMLAHGTEPLTDSAATAPPAKPVVHELAALVGDQVPRCGSGLADRPPQKRPDLHRRRRPIEDREAHDSSRVVIDGDGQPPAERPAVGQGEGQPGCPEAEAGGNRSQIGIPDVAGTPGMNGAVSPGRGSAWPSSWPLAQHVSDRGHGEMQPDTGEDLRDLGLAHRRTQVLSRRTM